MDIIFEKYFFLCFIRIYFIFFLLQFQSSAFKESMGVLIKHRNKPLAREHLYPLMFGPSQFSLMLHTHIQEENDSWTNPEEIRVWPCQSQDELKIVFENELIIALDKPQGLSFHRSGHEQGVFQKFREQQASGKVSYQGEIYSIHRLDRSTSGLLLLAKSRESRGLIQKAFESRQVQKCYVAISDKKPRKKMGNIVGDMSKSRRSQWKLMRTLNNPAITKFRSWEMVQENENDKMFVFLLQPETGRTHQLRVALKYISSPILGDPLYAPKQTVHEQDRCYLHSTALRLEVPGSGIIKILCPPSSGKLFLSQYFSQTWKQAILPSIQRILNA